MPKPAQQKRYVLVEKQPIRSGVLTPERKKSLSGDWYAPFKGP
jgi:hypothetical protein